MAVERMKRSARYLLATNLVLGALFVPVLCYWNAYSDIVAQSTELAVMSLIVLLGMTLVGPRRQEAR